MSAEEVMKFIDFVNFLTPRQRKMFIETASAKQLRLLEVACLNLTRNHTGLTAQQIKTAVRYKRPIKIFASKTFTIKEKRKIANQKGGFINAILPILASLAASFLTK